MCGCFRVMQGNQRIEEYLSGLPADAPPVKTDDVYPADIALVLALRDGIMAPEAMAWGFPRWDGKGVVFNARAETAPQKPMFSKALRERRAVVPASGFYEWRKNPERKRKDKFYFTAGDLLYIAAIWSWFGPEHGPAPRHFTLLTTAANPSMLPYHHRMPVLLPFGECLPWLKGEITGLVLEQEPAPVTAREIT